MTIVKIFRSNCPYPFFMMNIISEDDYLLASKSIDDAEQIVRRVTNNNSGKIFEKLVKTFHLVAKALLERSMMILSAIVVGIAHQSERCTESYGNNIFMLSGSPFEKSTSLKKTLDDYIDRFRSMFKGMDKLQSVIVPNSNVGASFAAALCGDLSHEF